MIYRFLLSLLLLSCGDGWASESDLPLTYIIPNNDVVSIEMVPIVAVSAQDQDGMYHTIKVDKDGYVLPSPCYEQMEKVMRVFLDADAMLKDPAYKERAAWQGGLFKLKGYPWQLRAGRFYSSREEAESSLEFIRKTYKDCVK